MVVAQASDREPGGDLFLGRERLIVVLVGCCFGLGAALIQGGLTAKRHHTVPPPAPVNWDNSNQLTCIEDTYDQRSRMWTCTAFSAVVIPKPKPYVGPFCPHMEVDASTSTWRCVSST